LAREWVMWRGEGSRRLSEEWGVRWCEETARGRPPFIAGERGRLGTGRSSMAMMLQGRRGSCDDAAVFYTSWRPS
jgi:hypothetical protein